MSRRPNSERTGEIEAGKPHCNDCGRLIVVGSGRDGIWQCEYCRVVASFDPAGSPEETN